jgi:LmbE family N-acetylglucosaminyl deacetylase
MNSNYQKSIAVIVAHPDDETLWAGGTILSHPNHNWFIVCLCRASDTDRAPRFYNALKLYRAKGIMGDIDDGPNQHPLNKDELEKEILKLLPSTHFDLILTHNSTGEYTRHLRHEEINRAVMSLWHRGKISAKELWTFAYEDGNKAYLPLAVNNADIVDKLSEKTWIKKYNIITETYGFERNSWEAETTPITEAFWKFKNPNHGLQLTSQLEGDIKMSKISICKLLCNPK